MKIPTCAPLTYLLLVLSGPAIAGWANAAQAPQERAPQEQAAVPTELEVRREVNRRMQDPQLGLPSAIEYVDGVLGKFPTDSELHLIAISLNMSHSLRLTAEEKSAEAAPFVRRAQVLATAVAANPKHLEAADEMLAQVFFSAAQLDAAAGDADAMYRSLDQAFEMGFDDLAALQVGPSFAAWQTDDTFASYVAKQSAQIVDRIAVRIRRELASFEAFDFDFKLQAVTGQPLAKVDFQGKILVVDVWGTWCPPCRQELPHFIALQDKYGAQGVQVVGLNSENDETVALQTARVKKAIEEFQINYPCALIDDAFLETIPEFEGFPTTLFIDRQGRVRLKMVGAQSHSRLETAVKLLLDETAAGK